MSVGARASLAKLVGNSGFPGPRSPATSYASLLAFDAAQLHLLLGTDDCSRGTAVGCCCVTDTDKVRDSAVTIGPDSVAKSPSEEGPVENAQALYDLTRGRGGSGFSRAFVFVLTGFPADILRNIVHPMTSKACRRDSADGHVRPQAR